MSALDIAIRHDKDCSYHYLGELAQANCDCGVTEALKELAALRADLETETSSTIALGQEVASLHNKLRNPWQPIETCPENKVVLVAWDKGYEIQVEQAEKINGFFGSIWGLSREFEPTHYMLIPELP